MKVVGYARVSTAEQAQQGISLDAQEAKMRAYADLYDLDLVAVQTDRRRRFGQITGPTRPPASLTGFGCRRSRRASSG